MIKTIGVSMFIYCLITGVIKEYKTEITGRPKFLHRNTWVRHFWTTYQQEQFIHEKKKVEICILFFFSDSSEIRVDGSINQEI